MVAIRGQGNLEHSEDNLMASTWWATVSWDTAGIVNEREINLIQKLHLYLEVM